APPSVSPLPLTRRFHRHGQRSFLPEKLPYRKLHQKVPLCSTVDSSFGSDLKHSGTFPHDLSETVHHCQWRLFPESIHGRSNPTPAANHMYSQSAFFRTVSIQARK